MTESPAAPEAPPPPPPPRKAKKTTRPTGSRAPEGARIALLVASVIGAIGLWLLLETMGVPVPELSRIWPLFIALGGLASLIDYFGFSKRPSSLGRAVFGLGLAAFFLIFTLEYVPWNLVLDWLPLLPFVAGLAFLTTWAAAGMHGTGNLVMGVVFALLGVLGLAARFPALRDLLPSIQLIWAISLLAVSALLIWRTFGNRS